MQQPDLALRRSALADLQEFSTGAQMQFRANGNAATACALASLKVQLKSAALWRREQLKLQQLARRRAKFWRVCATGNLRHTHARPRTGSSGAPMKRFWRGNSGRCANRRLRFRAPTPALTAAHKILRSPVPVLDASNECSPSSLRPPILDGRHFPRRFLHFLKLHTAKHLRGVIFVRVPRRVLVRRLNCTSVST